MMKAYELKIKYQNGEVDDYYTRLTGKGWETDAETPEEALEEMKKIDPETFEQMAGTVDEYWAEEIYEIILRGYSPENRQIDVILKDENVWIRDTKNGTSELWNDERYTEDDTRLIKFSLLNEGYRF